MDGNPEHGPMEALSAYIAGAAGTALPSHVVERCKLHLLDTLAAIVSGAGLLPGRKAIEYALQQGGRGGSTLIGPGIATSATNAALANGMLGHADETDDAHRRSRSHPGCAVVPAALAMAEQVGANGEALLRAIVLGYDIGTRVNFALSTQKLYAAGHATHSFAGLFGAAAAAGSLAGLSPQQCRWLMSYAAQQAGGVTSWRRDPDHIEKAFVFGGMPARDGVAAATMVAAGFTGVHDVFSGPRNFFMAFGQDPDPELLVAGLGERFEIMETNLKKWSVGMPNQAVLDLAQALLREHDIRPDHVTGIKLVMSVDENVVDDQLMPNINVKHLLSVILLDGVLTFASSHDAARVRDPAVAAFQKKIDLSFDPAVEMRKPVLWIEMADGRVLTRPASAIRGSPENPMDWDEVVTKATDLMLPYLGAARTKALADAVWRLDAGSGVHELMAPLRSRSA